MSKTSKRNQIIEAADQLFYQYGFDNTSFSDIAEIVKISRGNFYYHFKTKDQILDAVIIYRLNNTQMMLDQWLADGETPKERIRCFINILIMNQAKIKNFGCPVGSLTTELNKLNHSAQEDASQLFTLFRSWLKGQFQQLGCKKKADEFALYLLSHSQGVATLASAFNDEKLIKREVNHMYKWLDNCIENTV